MSLNKIITNLNQIGTNIKDDKSLDKCKVKSAHITEMYG